MIFRKCLNLLSFSDILVAIVTFKNDVKNARIEEKNVKQFSFYKHLYFLYKYLTIIIII